MTAQASERANRLASESFRPAGPRPGFVSGTMSSIKDIIAHRELLNLLIRRELKSRYKDSVLGFFWSLMRPLTQLLVYYLALGKFMGAAKGTPDFAVFIYAGLTIWTLFSEIVMGGTASTVANSGLIKKVYLPRELFPLSAIGSALFNFAIQLLLLVGATFLIGRPPGWNVLLYGVPALLLIFVLGTALALILSAANVYLRDIQYLVEVVFMVLFWMSPIVYPYAFVVEHSGSYPAFIGELYVYNPITAAVMGFQKAFWAAGTDPVGVNADNVPFQPQPYPENLLTIIGVEVIISIVLLWICQRAFSRLQANFAQEL